MRGECVGNTGYRACTVSITRSYREIISGTQSRTEEVSESRPVMTRLSDGADTISIHALSDASEAVQNLHV